MQNFLGAFNAPSSRVKGVVAAVVTVAIWSCFIVIARASAARTLGPFDIALCRMLGASVVLAPLGWYLVRTGQLQGGPSLFGLSPLALRTTAITGSLAGLGYALLSYSGFFFAPAAHASVLMPGSLPLWTALLAALFLHDRITATRALGLLCIVAGDLMVGGPSLLHAFEGGDVWKGDLLFMSAAICWAAFSIVVRHHRLEAVKSTVALTVFATMVYLPSYWLLSAFDVLPSRLAAAPWREIVFHMVFQGLGSVVISGITFTMMIKQFGPVRSTMITALVPGLSALGAVLFLGEPLYWNLLAGLALVTAGILFGVRQGKPVPAAVSTIKNEAVPAETGPISKGFSL
ncbi:DMT family transporter [Variovorax sp. HJSM1_2]|uniref:DMT family transporter n=1 Tax=Variovorax sp. HJSM1_2 TaxID=3366263 RepID=UPI003BE16434